MRKRFALHMKDDSPTIEGVLVKRSRREYILIAAQIMQQDRSIPMEGRVEVPREHVYCLQEIK